MKYWLLALFFLALLVRSEDLEVEEKTEGSEKQAQEELTPQQKKEKEYNDYLDSLSPEQREAVLQQQVQKTREIMHNVIYACVYVVRAKIQQQNETLHQLYSLYSKQELPQVQNKVFTSYAKSCQLKIGYEKYNKVFQESYYSKKVDIKKWDYVFEGHLLETDEKGALKTLQLDDDEKFIIELKENLDNSEKLRRQSEREYDEEDDSNNNRNQRQQQQEQYKIEKSYISSLSTGIQLLIMGSIIGVIAIVMIWAVNQLAPSPAPKKKQKKK